MRYSQQWFDTFLESIDPAQTRREVEFVARQCPLPRFRSLLDICCGPGRHAAELASMGYLVTGTDVDEGQLMLARQRVPDGASFLGQDLRSIEQLPGGPFDGAILLWQSFGQFDEATNADVLRQIAGKLVRGGRFILDIYHRQFFEQRQGTLQHERAGHRVRENKRMTGNRLLVKLFYDDDAAAQIALNGNSSHRTKSDSSRRARASIAC